MTWRRWVGPVGVVLTIMMAACAAPQLSRSPGPVPGEQAAPAAKKRIVAAIRGDPPTFSATIDAASVGGTAGISELEQLLHAGLGEVVDRRVVAAPRLAEAIPTVENGLWSVFPDGRMETVWTIKRGAQWHDGTRFTTEDLLFTVQVGRDRELARLGSRAYDFVESVEARDLDTVSVKWRRPFILADTMFTNEFALPLPKHLLERAYREEKETFTEHPYWTEAFVGAGPFKLRELVRGSHMTLEAFDGYILGRPKIDEIEVKFFIDPTVIVANVLAGTVELTLGRGLDPEQAFEAERQWPAGKMDLSYSSWIALFPQFLNPNPAIIANLQFRRALLHAADRQQMVDTLLLGKSAVAHSFTGPNAPEHPDVLPHTVQYTYDERTATGMLEGLGYKKGADGMFRPDSSGRSDLSGRDPTGQPLSVEVRTTAGDDLRAKATLAIADMWRRAGVGVETIIIPRQRASDDEYRVTRPGFELTRQPNELTEGALRRFHSRQVPLAENSWRGNNRARYSSPAYDALMDKYLVTFSARERLEVAGQINYHISDQLPAMGLFYSVQPMLVANRLMNVTAANDVRNAHEWDVR